ncbi:hypothetical protein, partial [Klebsiella pneumoniae]|uniref:hypothetical protein n=1 Tax=Klebsiella pneumoniae TaxID=573 RepID=UPI00190F2754
MPRKLTKKQEQEKLLKETMATSVLDVKDIDYVNNFAKEMINMLNNPLMYHPILQNEILKDVNMNPMYR